MIIKLSILPPYIQRSCKEWGLLWCGWTCSWELLGGVVNWTGLLRVSCGTWRLSVQSEGSNGDLNALSTQGCRWNSCGVSVKNLSECSHWISDSSVSPGGPVNENPVGGQSSLWRTVPLRLTESEALESTHRLGRSAKQNDGEKSPS